MTLKHIDSAERPQANVLTPWWNSSLHILEGDGKGRATAGSYSKKAVPSVIALTSAAPVQLYSTAHDAFG